MDKYLQQIFMRISRFVNIRHGFIDNARRQIEHQNAGMFFKKAYYGK